MRSTAGQVTVNDMEIPKEPPQTELQASPFETPGAIAGELSNLYGELKSRAKEITPEYIQERLDGPEGETWDTFPMSMFKQRVPLLDRITRRGDRVQLDAGYNHLAEERSRYHLRKEAITIQDGDTLHQEEAVRVRRVGKGYDPGDEYVAIGDRLYKADHEHSGPTPTFDNQGNLTYSAGRSWLGDTHHEVTEVSPDLTELLETLQAYRPTEDPEQPA